MSSQRKMTMPHTIPNVNSSELSLTPSQAERKRNDMAMGRKDPLDALSRGLKSHIPDKRSGLQQIGEGNYGQNFSKHNGLDALTYQMQQPAAGQHSQHQTRQQMQQQAYHQQQVLQQQPMQQQRQYPHQSQQLPQQQMQYQCQQPQHQHHQPPQQQHMQQMPFQQQQPMQAVPQAIPQEMTMGQYNQYAAQQQQQQQQQPIQGQPMQQIPDMTRCNNGQVYGGLPPSGGPYEGGMLATCPHCSSKIMLVSNQESAAYNEGQPQNVPTPTQ